MKVTDEDSEIPDISINWKLNSNNKSDQTTS